MSRGDTALLIIVVITLFILVPPAEGFILMLLRRLSLAGIAAISVLVILLLARSFRR